MRKVEGQIYRINFGCTGRCIVVECENEKELIECVVELEKKDFVSNVVLLDITGNSVRTPKVAVKTNPYYKSLMKDYFKK